MSFSDWAQPAVGAAETRAANVKADIRRMSDSLRCVRSRRERALSGKRGQGESLGVRSAPASDAQKADGSVISLCSSLMIFETRLRTLSRPIMLLSYYRPDNGVNFPKIRLSPVGGRDLQSDNSSEFLDQTLFVRTLRDSGRAPISRRFRPQAA